MHALPSTLNPKPATAMLGLLLALLPSGCLSTTYGGRIDTPFEGPAQFQTQSPGAAPALHWWKSLATPELDALVENALQDNLDVEIALARLAQARAGSDAADAGWWPRLDAELGAGRARNFSAFGPVENNQFSATLAASYEIDLWGQQNANSNAADYDAQAAAFDTQTVFISVSAELVATYLDVLYWRELDQILGVQQELANESLELLALRVGTASATAVDLIQQELQLSALAEQRIQVRAQEETARLALGVLSGKPQQLSVSQTRLPAMPASISNGVPADLLQQRPDLRAARSRLLAADERVLVAVAERLPGLRIGASGSLLATSPLELFDELFWSVIGSVTAPLFDGGLTAAGQRRAEAQADERLLQWAAAYLRAIEEVERAMLLENAQLETLASLQAQRARAEDALLTAREQFVLGVGDYFRVLGALETLQRLVQRELEARHRALLARVALHRALGGDWSDAVSERELRRESK